MKLKLFWQQLENVNICHFSSCDLLHKDGSVSVPFPSVRAVEMIDSLAENFKMRFNDFRSHATNISVFQVTDAPEKSHIEFNELQNETSSCSNVNHQALITSYASLLVSCLSGLR